MFKRQTTGSVVCASCGYLVGVADETCYHCGRRNPGLWGFGPALRQLGNDLGFVPFVMGACVVIYVLTLLVGGVRTLSGGGLDILPVGEVSLFMFGASGALPLFRFHRWWTVFSAGWLHANLLHIVFNLLWVRQLAPAVGELYGAGRMVIIYTAGGVLGFALTSLAGQYLPFLPFLRGAGLTVGASAPIFGLLGGLVYYGRRTGSRLVHGQALNWAITMFVFGLIMPGVDNYAHAGGFAGGYLAGQLLDPLKPERIDHLLGAVACIVVSMLSIVISILTFSLR
jgi:rhomboid protease GluP